ncbi:MAG: hypothetical protein CM15mP105_3100 [Methanobacteriota archaeon]|nr:MAG: hypothetical protein CM15mP105_3100 [Euryarchaeota archaeon]
MGTDSHSTPEVIILSTKQLRLVGHRHTCAIFDDASLKCWGQKNSDRLGMAEPLIPTPRDMTWGTAPRAGPLREGTYQPLPQKTTCILASRGFMVPDSGQTEQTGCSPGYY